MSETDRFGHATVEQLRAVLEQLEVSDIVIVNRVGNLSVIRKDEQIGYIELGNSDFASPDATFEEL